MFLALRQTDRQTEQTTMESDAYCQSRHSPVDNHGSDNGRPAVVEDIMCVLVVMCYVPP